MKKIKTHFFIALPLSNELRNWIVSYTDQLKNKAKFKKWVHEEDYHITLVFLGYVEQTQLESLNAQLREILCGIKSFSLIPSTVGTFGQFESPRIFWLGIEPSNELIELQNKIVTVCEHIGFELDKRPYSPHITVARKWIGEEEFSIQTAQATILHDNRPPQWKVDQVVLYQSHLGKSPMYEAIEIFKLKH